MSHLRHSSPFAPAIRPRPEEPNVTEESKQKDAEAAIQELKNLELLPLVLDIVENVNSGKLLPKDVDNAAGTLRVRINKAREILKTIHGLSETPEERATRVERMSKNINRKTDALQKLRNKVSERISLPDFPTPQPNEDIESSMSKEPTVEPMEQSKDEKKDEDVKMEESEPTVKKDETPMESQPLGQTDTFMTDDATFDMENFNDFPSIGDQDQDQDINMDT